MRRVFYIGTTVESTICCSASALLSLSICKTILLRACENFGLKIKPRAMGEPFLTATHSSDQVFRRLLINLVVLVGSRFTNNLVIDSR